VSIITKIQQNYNTFLENKNSKNKNIRDLCIIIAIFYYNELRLLIKNRSQHSFRTIQRAMIIFDLTNRIDIVSISKKYNVSRNSVYGTIKRVVEIYEKYGNHPNFSFKEALEDHKRPGRAPIYDEKEITRILLTCCADPMALGHYSECWTVTTLTNHINKARSEENINNRKISRSKIYKAIYSCGIRIDSIEYYLEKRDSDFDKKAINILNSLEFAKVIAGEVSFEDFQKRNDLKDIDIDSIKRNIQYEDFLQKSKSLEPYKLKKNDNINNIQKNTTSNEKENSTILEPEKKIEDPEEKEAKNKEEAKKVKKKRL